MAAFSLHTLKQRFVRFIPSLHHEHTSYKWWVLANVMIGTFMAVLDATIVDVSLAKLMAAFGISVDKVEWVVTAYMLVFAVMLPTSGWIADHFGYKRTYFLALLLFALGSFLCGQAWSEDVLILARIIQATGAGMLMPVGLAIITREFPPQQRGLAMGFWAISAAASVSLGPMIGGFLIDNINWNSIFNVNVPVGIMGLFATLVIQREYKTEHSRSFDIIGFLSMATFLSALLLALTDANAKWNTGGWTSPFIVSCLMISALAFTIFLVTEFNIKHPLIEMSLFKDFNFTVANGILFIFGFGMFGSTFLLPLYLQNSLGYTAFQAGSLFLPGGVLQAMMAPTAGYLSDKINPKILAGVGLMLLAFSLFLNSSLSMFSEHYQIMIPLYIRGIGMGMIFTPLTSIALSNVPRQKTGQASGLYNIIRQIGGSFGIAFMSSLLARRVLYHSAIYGQVANPQSDIFRQVVRNLSRFSADAMAGNTSLVSMRAQALIAAHIGTQSFVKAVGDVFLVASGVTIIAVIPVLFLRYEKKVHHEKPAAID